MKRSPSVVRLPGHDDETIAPVTIMDAQGRVVRVVPAAEFPRSAPAGRGHWLERRRRLPRPPAAGTAPAGVPRANEETLR